MKGNPEVRAVSLGLYIIENNATVRQAAKHFGVSKSTVHKDVTERLQYINFTLRKQVAKVLADNLEARAMRGGESTKAKWERLRK